MKIKEGYILSEIADEYLVVPVAEETEKFCGVIKLNETAADIWHGIEEGKSAAQIASEIVEKYDGVDSETAMNGVLSIINQLIEQGIIEA